MKAGKKILTWLLALALVMGSIPWQSQTAQAAAVKGTGYTLSKKAGTYNTAVKVKIKVKKGYYLYYTTTGKFKAGQKILSGKSKTVSMTKTTTLSVYAIKNGTKKKAAGLNKASARKKKGFASYTYKIKKGSSVVENTEADTETTDTSGESEKQSVATATPDNGQQSENLSTPPADGNQPPEIPGGNGQTDSSDTGDNEAAQAEVDDLTAAVNATVESIATAKPEEKTLEDGVSVNTAQKVTLSGEGAEFSVGGATNTTDAVTYTASTSSSSGMASLTIKQEGTYVLTGGSEINPVEGLLIDVAKGAGEVVLIWDNLYIDNSSYGAAEGQDAAVFTINKNNPQVTVFLKGTSVLKGTGSVFTKVVDDSSVTSLPSAVIYAKDSGTTLTFADYGEENGTLKVMDSMADTTDFGGEDPSDGIASKGTLVLQSGTFNVTANGDALKGTGDSGTGGVVVLDGDVTLSSNLGNGIRSKNASVSIYGGNIDITSTKADGLNAKNYSVNIIGGSVRVENCYEDGIQGENVVIAGEDTEVSLTTCFENAGKNYYNTSLGTGNYNTISTSGSTKTEVVNVDTGSHKGIKAGTKTCSFSYKAVEAESSYEAGVTYTEEASGGLVVAGGTITIDTTATGIKYNGSGNAGGMGGGSSSSAATSEGQYIIGAPDDTIHSNNTCVLAGGTLTLNSGDDGITSATSLSIINDCNIKISTAYEGIESGDIVIGSAGETEKTPKVVIYSNDDGINASSKEKVVYTYEDESEAQYTKTETSSSDNCFEMLAGYLNVMIADDVSHSVSLPVEGSSATNINYTANGDGIDCNGSFYAYGGTIVVFGSTSNDNSAVDTDGAYYIGNGVTLLAVGSSGMVENPTNTAQITLSTTDSGSSSGGNTGGPGGQGGPGGMGGQGGPGSNSSTSYSAGTVFGITDGDGNTILAMQPAKSYSYVLYSSPALASGKSYTLYSGGSVSGEKKGTYDYRYDSYNTSGASAIKTVTP